MARVVVAGYIVRFPLGGQAWAHLQYLLGLRALGHDVLFCEDAGWRDACYDPERGLMSDDPTYGVRRLSEWLECFGLGAHWIFRDRSRTTYGLPDVAVRSYIAGADILVNLSGVTWFDGFERIPVRIFIDEDPVFTQIHAESDADYAALLRLHQTCCTYGHNLGQPNSEIPLAGLKWQPTQQPIALDQWPVQSDAPAGPFTTILSWNAYGEATYGDRCFGAKSRSFPIVRTLPQRTQQTLELAVSGDEVSVGDLVDAGWCVRDPLAVSRTLDSYREYIQRSRGEFSIAKHGYVVSHCGWFSDRSAEYLTSGRPVILQDTGFGSWLPVGDGLLAFSTLDEAVDAIDRVNGDYARHRHAARAIAEEYFEARRVLARLLERL